MRRVCVFCGSKEGTDSVYREAAGELGRLLTRAGWGLVYGGGSVGLMGVLADAVLDGGGEVIGVIPEFLATRELLHGGVSQMHVVTNMHTRKAKMAELSGAFIALAGGYGTLEELFEVITWAQLGIHTKPIAVLNTAGYFDALIALIDHAIAEHFIHADHRRLLAVLATPADLVSWLAGQPSAAVANETPLSTQEKGKL